MKYLMRSLMFVPGHRESFIRNAVESDADVLLLDIEDSVQPPSNKKIARQLINRLLDEGIFQKKRIFVRINDRESGELLDDLELLMRPEIEGFVYPKSKGAEDIFFIDRLLEALEFKRGLVVGQFDIIPLIETTEAVLNALNIAKSSQRVVGLAYGCEDFLTDLQGTHALNELSLSVPRAMIAMAARAAGITPIDTVHIKVHDIDDLEKNLEIAKTLGFEGMLVLNPKEIPYVHRFFSPTADEIKRATDIVKHAAEAEASGLGVAIVGGKFIGPPLLAGAKQTLLKAKLIDERG